MCAQKPKYGTLFLSQFAEMRLGLSTRGPVGDFFKNIITVYLKVFVYMHGC